MTCPKEDVWRPCLCPAILEDVLPRLSVKTPHSA